MLCAYCIIYVYVQNFINILKSANFQVRLQDKLFYVGQRGSSRSSNKVGVSLFESAGTKIKKKKSHSVWLTGEL